MRLEQKKVSKPSIFGFFSEKEMSFFKKNLIFLELEKGGKFTVECVSNGTIPQKYIFCTNFFLEVGEVRKYVEERVFFREKKRFKTLLRKMGGHKKRWLQPAVLFLCNQKFSYISSFCRVVLFLRIVFNQSNGASNFPVN